jgi:hypothetical protein
MDETGAAEGTETPARPLSPHRAGWAKTVGALVVVPVLLFAVIWVVLTLIWVFGFPG